jgi:hypothetical protein
MRRVRHCGDRAVTGALVRSLVRSLARAVVRGSPAAAEEEPAQFITNGGFAADTNWTKGAGWTIAAGVAANSGAAGTLSQDFGALVAALINGNSYVLTFDLVNVVGGDITATLTGGAGSQVFTASATGLVTHNITATDARTMLAIRSVDGDAITVDNVSLVPA